MTPVQRNTLDFEMLFWSHLLLENLKNGLNAGPQCNTWSLSLGQCGRTSPERTPRW